MWRDTMLLVVTDHGFLLGEHDWWGKMRMPWYNGTAHIPLFAWDPRAGVRGARRRSLTTTIDIGPTLLDYFGLERPPDMDGTPLRATVEEDARVRDTTIYGMFGAHVNITDGRYVYMRGPVEGNAPLYQYTLMPSHLRRPFSVRELADMQWHPPLGFTKGCPVMRIPSTGVGRVPEMFQTQIFDLATDPGQLNPIEDDAVEARMVRLLEEALATHQAPPSSINGSGSTAPDRPRGDKDSPLELHDQSRRCWPDVPRIEHVNP